MSMIEWKESAFAELSDIAANMGGLRAPVLLGHLANETDFLDAPASRRFHLSFSGGLLIHTLGVVKEAVRFCVENPHLQVNVESAVLRAMAHDLCKTGFYGVDFKWTKKNNKWERELQWVINDSLPLGHGEKSLFMTQKVVQLSDMEACAIRFHMGAWDESITASFPLREAFGKAFDHPLVKVIHLADVS